MITGESGSGKELVARALHKHSPRAGGPFVAINTAAIPKDLLESELFGHERGAFTGAQTTRRGRFEQADGGTLFLDEIGDMPFDLQTRLLRVLSDGQFYRVGGHQPLKANVRVIAATHQNLEERVRHGVFREDLFHRLNVIRLRLPPLRERREDIPMLTRFFLARSAKELGVDAKRISEAALQRLAAFDFPGNVRQLENVCHWITVMAPAQVVEVDDLPPELLAGPRVVPAALAGSALAVDASPQGAAVAASAEAVLPSTPAASLPVASTGAAHGTAGQAPAEDWVGGMEREVRALLSSGQEGVWDTLTRRFEARMITAALDVTRGRRIEAAQRLGIGRNTITRKIQELGLDDE
jgi:two-component system nitrogen regulation response regulator GlnG